MEFRKAKSTAKVVTTKGPKLMELIRSCLGTISELVGATLGPGGRGVLIERYEHNLPPIVTKDGVTCYRAMGFTDATKQTILEAARDASVRTASEAGDGTTTAAVLSEAIVSRIDDYTKAHPQISPQKVVRRLERAFKDLIEPAIREVSIKADITTDEGKSLLRAVAKTSANGDSDLADAVMACYDITGDEGNVTIIEEPGPSGYEVEEIKGFGVPVGYEESTGKLWAKFVNDPATARCVMDRPVFVIYHGKITEIQTIQLLMEKIGTAWGNKMYDHHNVVLVATGFSESVLAELAVNFPIAFSINVYPLLAPQSPTPGGQLGFLEDLCAITGARLFDPMNYPCDQGEFADLGPGVEAFEAGRYRSNIVGHAEGPLFQGYDEEGNAVYDETTSYEDGILLRIDELRSQAASAPSQLDKMLLEERIAKLSGGIARLKVVGPSNGETKEKRDRAEDAVCAVRGAIKNGCLPAGGWTLMRLSVICRQTEDEALVHVLSPALEEPVRRLLENAGLSDEEVQHVLEGYVQNCFPHPSDDPAIYDAERHEWVNCKEDGVLDSVPAVLEAIRNSVSIAALLGTLGGTVVFARDENLERSEARDTADFLRNANVNEANERA